MKPSQQTEWPNPNPLSLTTLRRFWQARISEMRPFTGPWVLRQLPTQGFQGWPRIPLNRIPCYGFTMQHRMLIMVDHRGVKSAVLFGPEKVFMKRRLGASQWWWMVGPCGVLTLWSQLCTLILLVWQLTLLWHAWRWLVWWLVCWLNDG